MAEITETAPKEITAAVAAVRDTFNSGKTKNIEWRRAQIKAILRLVTENQDSIAAAMKQDLSVNKFMTHVVELEVAVSEAKLALANLDSWAAPKYVGNIAMSLPSSSFILPEPYGVVLVMSPWNYPVSLVLAPLIAAVAAGNAVVIKPSELSPNTSLELGRLAAKYLDNDAIRFVQGGVATATSLLEHRFDFIKYTGNGAVARIVHRAANKHLTPVLLELGGKSPAIVTDSADLAKSIKRIVWGKYTMNMGQTCITTDYIITTPKQYDSVVTLLKKTIEKFYTTTPETCSDVSRIINERHTTRLAALLNDPHIKILHGGQVDIKNKYIAPTVVLANVDALCLKSEIFGPILPILVLPDLDAAIKYINEHDKPLALYLFSEDSNEHKRVLRETSSGAVGLNECIVHAGNPELPFGGVGESGMGSYHGEFGFKAFSHDKPVLKKYGDDPSVRFPPYTDGKLRILSILMSLDLKTAKKFFFLAVLVGLLAVAVSYVGTDNIARFFK